jgi:ubiquinone/menaquinone biosynthesis C-methylase UbiE
MAQPEPFLRPDQFWTELDLRANQTVVHLGCGPGYFLLPAARVVGQHGQAIGVDIREDMLREVEGQAQREGLADIIKTYRWDLEKGPTKTIKANTADWTLLVNILPQADPVKIIREAKRVTKIGGMIIIVEWLLSQATIGPPVANRITRNEILTIIDKLRLTLHQTFSPSPYHYGLLVKIEN